MASKAGYLKWTCGIILAVAAIVFFQRMQVQINAEKIITEKIQAAFSSGKKEVFLSEITDFEWDRACMFMRPDASSDFYADVYANELINKEGLKGQPLPPHIKKPILLLLFIKKDEVVHVYYNQTDQLNLNGIPAAFYASIEGHAAGGCLNSKDAYLTLKAGKSYTDLIFGRRR